MKKQKRVFDTSVLLSFIKGERGSAKIAQMLEQGLEHRGGILISSLSIYELVAIIGRRNIEKAIAAVAFLERAGRLIPPAAETAQNAALLKIKYPGADLSLADAIIIQTGIEEGAVTISAPSSMPV